MAASTSLCSRMRPPYAPTCAQWLIVSSSAVHHTHAHTPRRSGAYACFAVAPQRMQCCNAQPHSCRVIATTCAGTWTTDACKPIPTNPLRAMHGLQSSVSAQHIQTRRPPTGATCKRCSKKSSIKKRRTPPPPHLIRHILHQQLLLLLKLRPGTGQCEKTKCDEH